MNKRKKRKKNTTKNTKKSRFRIFATDKKHSSFCWTINIRKLIYWTILPNQFLHGLPTVNRMPEASPNCKTNVRCLKS